MKATFTDSSLKRTQIVGANAKTATVRRYTTIDSKGEEKPYWHLCYDSNGRSKNFDHYHQVLTHLESRGW